MSTNPNQSQNPDPADRYGGYTGYNPSNPADDPYGAASRPAGSQPTGPGSQQSDPTYVYGQQGATGQPGTGQSYNTYGQTGQQYNPYGQQGQQQQTYQPPLSATRGRSGSGGAYDQSSTGLQARRAAFFSYLGFCFTGIVFFFLERKNRFVRFNAAQSIILFTPILLAYIVLRIVTVLPLIGFLLNPVAACLTTVLLVPAGLLWLFLMVQAYRGVTVKLPIVGNYAEALVARFSKGRTI